MPIPGDPIRLCLQLGSGATNKFVRAFLFDQNGNALTGQEQFDLVHVARGQYINNDGVFPAIIKEVRATIEVYNDSGYTQRSRPYPSAIQIFSLEVNPGETFIINQQNLVGIMVGGDAVVGTTESTNNLSGSLDQDNLVIGGLVNGGVVGGVLVDDDELSPTPVPGTNQTIQGNLLC